MKKSFYCELVIVGIVLLVGGGFAYYIYSDVTKTLDAVHKPLNREKSDKREEKVNIADQKPISILMMGVDQRENETGRSDSLILFTLNPKQKSMKMTSIPRILTQKLSVREKR